MNHLTVNALKKALKEEPNHGICGVLQTLYAKMPTSFTTTEQRNNFNLMLKCCEALDFYSDRRTFPIQVGDKDPCIMYRDAKIKRTLWSSKSKYGRARRATVKLMIEELENGCNTINTDRASNNNSNS